MRAAAEVLAAGDVLGGRYRLERLVGAERAPVGTGLWRAHDLTLSRAVAIRTVVDPSAAMRGALFAAASRASAAHEPRLAATYDADVEPAPPGDDTGMAVTYLVREWVEGEPLSRQLADVGLEPGRLPAVLASAAEAVAALHAAGGWHGRVHPDNLVVEPDGRVRLTDPGVGLALALTGDRDASGRPCAPPPLPPAVVADLGLGPRPLDAAAIAADPSLLRRAQRYDTCDLGRVLYAAATGTWVGGGWRGLRAAPSDGERPRRPRQVRAAVSRELDAVIVRTLLPPPGRQAALQDAAAVAVALGRIGAVPADPPPARTGRRPRRPRRWAVRALLLGLIAVLGVVGYGLGRNIGRVPGTTLSAPTFAATPTPSGSAPTPAADLQLRTVTAFDPPPGDGAENDDQVPLAYDGSTATAWTTERYATPDLGAAKPGVGLLVDLGSVRRVGTVQLALVGAPTSVELRAANQAGTTLDGFPVVSTAPSAPTTVTLTANADHRFWLVWLTSLPRVSGGYRGGVAELRFRP